MENSTDIIKVSRGRPRKPRPPEEENNEVEKRGRGRPRKPLPDPNLPKPPKPPKPRKPKTLKEVSIWRDNKPLYFKLYYQNRPRAETECMHCGNTFDSKMRLNNHLTRSVLCKKLRESKENTETTELSNLD